MLKNLSHIALFTLMLALATFEGTAQKNQGHSATANSAGCGLYVPNAFTPNGDHINERFVIGHGEDCRLVEFHMKVFDRWGRLVFETNSADRSEAWDGKSEGKELQKGVYIYDVHAKLESLSGSAETEVVNRKGTVVLIR